MIQIIEGHNSSSYFWIMPVKIKDITKNTDDFNNVEEYRELEISIEEEDIRAYLFPILLEFFDDNLEENKKRGVEYVQYINPEECSTFEWYLTYNYYTFENIENMINKIKELIALLNIDYNSKKLEEIKKQYDWLLYETSEYNPNKNYTENEINDIIERNKDMIIDFYERFIKYMQNMIIKGKEKGYSLISFMGP